MNIGKWTAGIDWGRVPLLKTVLCQKGGTLPLTRAGSQNLLVADLTSAHVVSTVTLSIGQYTYAYDYPVSYTHTHTFDNFFKGGTVPLMLDVLRLSLFYLLQT